MRRRARNIGVQRARFSLWRKAMPHAAHDPLLAPSNPATPMPPVAGPGALLQATIDPAVVIGVLLACVLWFGGRFDGPYLVLALIVFSMTFPASLAAGGNVRGGGAGLARSIAGGWLAIAVLLVLLGWASRTLEQFDQRAILAWLLATPLALFAAHTLAPRLLADGLRRRAVIAGTGAAARRLGEHLSSEPLLGVTLDGFFDDRSAPRGDGTLGTLERLPEYVRANNIQLIYIALPMASQPRIVRLLEDLSDSTASIYFVPDIFVCDLIQARVDSVGGMPVLAVCESPFYGVNGLVKRASDLVLGALLLLLAAPAMLLVAAVIKLESPGPVLFKQRRYGLDGREILVWKFRSMRVQEDGGQIRQATRNDSRVTRFGAFLRASSLDELPQLINVLQGRMSVIGPRPHAVAHNELYRKRIRGYMMRHKVRPGITGLAQVSGWRGETDTLDKMERRIEHDLAYLRNWSLWLDLKILVKTVLVVLRRDNAY
jgi:putative colanic acid biosynthesis UDP-glucose lipid carrier transferase